MILLVIKTIQYNLYDEISLHSSFISQLHHDPSEFPYSFNCLGPYMFSTVSPPSPLLLLLS
jgi:hypothetical protein